MSTLPLTLVKAKEGSRNHSNRAVLFLAELGVDVFAHPQGSIRAQDGNVIDRGGFTVVRGDKPMVLLSSHVTGSARSWTLWHEAAHAIDVSTTNLKWSEPIFERAVVRERGRLSRKLVSVLERHRSFINRLGWHSYERLTAAHMEGLFLNDDTWRAFMLRVKSQAPLEAMNKMARERAHFRAKETPGRHLDELFAETVAAAVTKPDLLAGCDALVNRLREVLDGSGFHLKMGKGIERLVL